MSGGSSIKELFTLWYSRKWSTGLGTMMFVVAIGDVLFTLLNIEKFGIAGEANPIARSMIEGGQLSTILWIVVNLLSTILIYIPLISLQLMQPVETHGGKLSTIVSVILATRITVTLYNAVIFRYPAMESGMTLIVVGVILTFSIRFVMRNGDYISMTATRMALHRLLSSFKSFILKVFSAKVINPFSFVFRVRKQKRMVVNSSFENSGNPKDGRLERGGPGLGRKRRVRRIVILVSSLIAVPIVLFTLLQIIVDLSGIQGVSGLIFNVVRGSQAQADLFLIGFILAIASMIAMIYLIMALIEELRTDKGSI